MLACAGCAASGTAQAVAFEQLFFNVGAGALLEASADAPPGSGFSEILHTAEADAPLVCSGKYSM